jgi:catalase-peroxidase
MLLWQDPVPTVDHALIDANDIKNLKAKLLSSGLTVPQLVKTAWAAAASFRGTDMRGGANGARLALAPQKDWAANDPKELAKVLPVLQKVQQDFNKTLSGGKKVSLADVIVLAGSAAVEQAAKDAGLSIEVPFHPGRTDATAAQTDAASFAVLEPLADGFRNYHSSNSMLSPAAALIDKAAMLNLSVPEMTVLVGGLRVLNANSGGVRHGVLTNKVGTLSNDFFVNLLDMSTKWQKSASSQGLYEGVDRKTNQIRWTATPVDLMFGSHAELRAVAEVYAAADGKERFARDFAKAWQKVMELDRFDL